MALHEVLHETKKQKKVGITLKLDFEKAYDKVDWNCLFDCLKYRGFNSTWCDWIKKVVTGGTICVKVNNQLGPYFVSKKGVRQGDPLSPILFNFVADCLTRMVLMAQNNGLITGLADNLIPNGVAILQYADDTILCLENNLEKARNVKLLLYMYELISGLKINFLKSEVVLINGDDIISREYAEIFNCQVGLFPIKYLGVPVSPSRLHVIDWVPLEDKNKKKLDIWKGGSMSIVGRTTLIDSSLSNSFIYHMSLYWLPKTIVDNLDKQRRSFFWQGGGQKRKYHLVKWEVICRSKKKGGLGIKDIRKMNASLLCKWWWRLENENGICQDLVKAKYLRDKMISNVTYKVDDSPIWTDLLKIKHVYLKGRKMHANNGSNILLWTDPWSEGKALCAEYCVLYELCEEKTITLRNFWNKRGHLNFRRWLPDFLQVQWDNLRDRILAYQHNESQDKITWGWTKSGNFSVKSTYEHLTSEESGTPHPRIWKSKLPYKMKIFLGILKKGATLTKENMIKRNWTGDPTCRFCDAVETTDHLFFQCPTARVVWGIVAKCIGVGNIPVNINQYWRWIETHLPNGKQIYSFGLAAICWAIWKTRNKACFEHKLINHPAEIVCYACSLMTYWTGLHKADF